MTKNVNNACNDNDLFYYVHISVINHFKKKVREIFQTFLDHLCVKKEGVN